MIRYAHPKWTSSERRPPGTARKDKVPVAYAVNVDGVWHKVSALVESGSRGLEYEIIHPEQGVVTRTCFAPAWAIKEAFADGERLEYIWEGP